MKRCLGMLLVPALTLAAGCADYPNLPRQSVSVDIDDHGRIKLSPATVKTNTTAVVVDMDVRDHGPDRGAPVTLRPGDNVPSPAPTELDIETADVNLDEDYMTYKGSCTDVLVPGMYTVVYNGKPTEQHLTVVRTG